MGWRKRLRLRDCGVSVGRTGKQDEVAVGIEHDEIPGAPRFLPKRLVKAHLGSLEIEVTVDDPDTFNQPWKGKVRLDRGRQGYTEFVCSEGNHNLFDYGLPEAKKADF